MEQKLAIDVTVSGSPKSGYMLPNGNIKYFGYFVWDGAKPYTFKLNALAVEKFQKQTYPVVDASAKKKDISKLKEFWYSIWDVNKIYDIMVKAMGGEDGYHGKDGVGRRILRRRRRLRVRERPERHSQKIKA